MKLSSGMCSLFGGAHLPWNIAGDSNYPITGLHLAAMNQSAYSRWQRLANKLGATINQICEELSCFKTSVLLRTMQAYHRAISVDNSKTVVTVQGKIIGSRVNFEALSNWTKTSHVIQLLACYTYRSILPQCRPGFLSWADYCFTHYTTDATDPTPGNLDNSHFFISLNLLSSS